MSVDRSSIVGRTVLRGRGVYYFEGEMPCPLSGIGTRGEHASIRLAFDDDASEATFDRGARRLAITNRRSYQRRTLFGDLIILGRGRTQGGVWVPVSMHTRFDKTGDRLMARPHLHPTVSGALAEVELEPIEVVIDGVRVLDPELAQRVAIQPPLAEWLGRALFSIRSNRPTSSQPSRFELLVDRIDRLARRQPRSVEAGSLLDLTVGLGVGRLAVPLVRAELRAEARTSSVDARGQRSMVDARRRLVELLAGEAWSLRFTVLSSFRDLCEHFARGVFLLGLDQVPALRRVRDGAIERGDVMRFARDGHAGVIEVGRERATIDNIAEVARAFLEYDILGSVIAQAVIAGESGEIVV